LCFVNIEKIREASEYISRLEIKEDDFLDERFYPPKNTDLETVARYFFFIVAIDHRTTTRGKKFEGYVEKKFYRGSDLLYRLASRKIAQDPDFFSPRRMAEIDAITVKNWLRPDEPSNITIPDPERRAMLLRDAGEKLLRYYNGRVMEIIEKSGNWLYTDSKNGFIDRLKIFRAYEDPVEKKAFLLAKFLLRRGLVNFKDIEKLQLPIDNHLTRIALRLGLVSLTNSVTREAYMEEDIAIRMIVRRAYKILAKQSELREDILDDFLWVHGRTCCTFDTPLCDNCKNPTISSENCPLRHICSAYKSGVFPKEHIYEDTWYY